MLDLKTLISKNEHSKILELEGPEYNKYKTVAAIFLNKFEDALVYADNDSFEKAYVLYRLKRYKRALRIVKKHNTKKSKILMAQCLYNIGYYAASYEILSQYGNSDEYAVNLQAMESMESLTRRNQYKLSFFSVNCHEELKKKIKLTYNNPACLIEGEFNKIYEKVDNEKKYLDALYEAAKKYKLENSIFEKQIKVIRGEEFDTVDCTNMEREIINLNRKKIQKLSNPIHFLKNFQEFTQKFALLRFAIDDKFNGKEFMSGKQWSSVIIHPENQNDIILKALNYLKNGGKKKNKVEKWLLQCEESYEKQLLLFINSDLSNPEIRKTAVDFIISKKIAN